MLQGSRTCLRACSQKRATFASGRLDATDDEIAEAAKQSGAHEFIMRLEHGYDTDLHERGQNISVGQRQLLSFARAVVAEPRILVLDEATANVDTQTEIVIQQALRRILKGRTSFVIAHRLSTIRDADRVIVLDQAFPERGNHEQLLALDGITPDQDGVPGPGGTGRAAPPA